MVHLFILVILLFSSPVSAQWSIEESQQTDPLASRPTATAASLVSDDGRLAWEYMCVRTTSGRYTESLELYTERSGEQFRGGTIRYRFDDGEWQRARWNSGGSWLGFHSDEEMRQFLDMLRRYRSLIIEVETNGGQVTTAFNRRHPRRDSLPSAAVTVRHQGWSQLIDTTLYLKPEDGVTADGSKISPRV